MDMLHRLIQVWVQQHGSTEYVATDWERTDLETLVDTLHTTAAAPARRFWIED